jgi:hypothetical protein
MYNLGVVSLAMRPPWAQHDVGEWLSLVEHLVRDQGVGGSNPLSPTNYLNPVIELASFLFPSFRALESTWVD